MCHGLRAAFTHGARVGVCPIANTHGPLTCYLLEDVVCVRVCVMYVFVCMYACSCGLK